MTPEEEAQLSAIFHADPNDVVMGEGEDQLCEPNMDEDEERDPEEIQADIDKIIEDLRTDGWKLDDAAKAEKYCELANLYNELKTMDLEERTLDEGLKFAPDHPEMNHMKGMIFLERKADEQPKEALSFLREAVRQDPHNSDYVAGLGLCLSYCGDDMEAVEVLKKAHELDEENIQTLLALIECFEISNDTPNAIKYMKKVCELQPDNPEWQEMLASFESVSKDFDEPGGADQPT